MIIACLENSSYLLFQIEKETEKQRETIEFKANQLIQIVRSFSDQSFEEK